MDSFSKTSLTLLGSLALAGALLGCSGYAPTKQAADSGLPADGAIGRGLPCPARSAP